MMTGYVFPKLPKQQSSGSDITPLEVGEHSLQLPLAATHVIGHRRYSVRVLLDAVALVGFWY